MIDHRPWQHNLKRSLLFDNTDLEEIVVKYRLSFISCVTAPTSRQEKQPKLLSRMRKVVVSRASAPTSPQSARPRLCVVDWVVCIIRGMVVGSGVRSKKISRMHPDLHCAGTTSRLP